MRRGEDRGTPHVSMSGRVVPREPGLTRTFRAGCETPWTSADGGRAMERWAIEIQGIVQGVGFRPFVHGLAARHGLGGFVRNRTGTVLIEVEGEPESLDRFLAELRGSPPPLSRIERLAWEKRQPLGDREFRVQRSEDDGESPVFLSPDVATCADCLAELADPKDRRYAYPFLNCTNCGPRLTIIRGAPYDRERTTMAAFAMCDACRAEYDDPRNRRFHAEPTACPACGPRLSLLDASGRPIANGDPLRQFAESLRAGKIGALKGIGGFHLACDATNAEAVAELRRRKHRDEKPFAIMVPDLAAAAALVEIDSVEAGLLTTPRRPIVLLRKRVPCSVAAGIAPGNPWLGVLLPYSPLHHLLMEAVEGLPLVMTSGNRSDEPIAFGDDAVERLGGIADLYLVHDRAIHVRCDDSVTRVVDGDESPIRRSRGYAPMPIALPHRCPQALLAVGGQLKGTFALGRDRHAILSQHMGDLDHFDAYRAFVRDVALYEQLFAIRPRVLVHDLHPDYATTRYAQARAGSEGQILLAVQHHHAHVASCMAEHGLDEPVIGVAFDGTGYGTDGAIWGGEFLIADYRNFQRAAHLRYVRLPGGDQAIREPWRVALAHLIDAGAPREPFEARFLQAPLRAVTRMIERGVQSPPTSSMGRLFDAVASLVGIRDRVSFEGQAAIELEWLATETPPDYPYPVEFIDPTERGASEAPLVIDTRPLIRGVARDVGEGVSPARIARRFHSTLVELIAAACVRLRAATRIEAVVLSGGVFLNVLLTREVTRRLATDGFRVSRHRLVPPNDGGLSLGQLAIAAARVS
jgi:hydrogenase maturation protein HypF